MKLRAAASAALLFASASALAVDVRGRIDLAAYNGTFPMVNAAVQLCRPPQGCTPVYRTGQDGMYYLAVAAGQYELHVNGRVVGQVMVPNAPAFDVAPFRGN